MRKFKIDLAGQPIPTADGAVNTYVFPEAKAQKRFFTQSRQVIFVNGMDNRGEDHATSALALSFVQMCPVIGVYNATAGRWLGLLSVKDLLQCAGDKNQFNGLSFSARNRVRIGTSFSERTGEQVMVDALSRNPAQVSLFRELRKPQHRTSEIFAHSQGNLIVSNVLQAIAAVDGRAAIAGRVVHSFGSPNVVWPTVIKKQEHGFTFDLINWLSGFDASFSISKVGQPSGSLSPFHHDFMVYLENDPAFVVNRFRVGLGPDTYNMDEDGLAECLAAMGTNIPRVREVMKHLAWNHRSDVDDVAVLYVGRIRNSPAIRHALAADRELLRLLIRVLDDGWTSAREKQAIAWLETL